MTTNVFRVECDVENGSSVGMFLAEYHTKDENIKKVCRKYRSQAPWMPEPEHESFSHGIPYCVVFGCTSARELMKWFGHSKTLLREVLKVFKLRVYSCEEVYLCEEQVGFIQDDATTSRRLSFKEFNEMYRQELRSKG